MDFVESSLCRLQDSVNRFVVPSAALRDVRALKAQIELRGRALREIEVICCRLRPFMRCESKRLRHRPRNRLGRRSSFADSFLAGRVIRPCLS
jgi:branched-subunit amino acid aminotransferase/4-amino-4-deoxychorismate lyase